MIKLRRKVRFMDRPHLHTLEIGGEIVSMKYYPGHPQYFSGKVLFELKATHGIPLDISLIEICNKQHLTVRWDEFIDTARANKRWDFQTFDEIKSAMEDAGFSKYRMEGILEGFKRYVQVYPHPNL